MGHVQGGYSRYYARSEWGTSKRKEVSWYDREAVALSHDAYLDNDINCLQQISFFTFVIKNISFLFYL